MSNGGLSLGIKKQCSHQESPTLKLMNLAIENGIRPQTTSNGQHYLFFVPNDKIPGFLAHVKQNYGDDFVSHIEHKIATDKMDQELLKNPLPHWF